MKDAISVQKLKETVKYRIVLRPLGGEKPLFKTTSCPITIAFDRVLPRLDLILTYTRRRFFIVKKVENEMV